jgi:hypothetical protein
VASFRPGFDAAEFLTPWLKEKQAPRLRTEQEGRRVTIVQDGPAFVLPVTLEATTSQGTERRRVWIRGSRTEVEFTEPVSAVRIDPDEELLIKR